MLCKETEIGRLARSPSSCNTPLARAEMWSKASGSRLIFLKPLAYMVSLKHTCINVPQLSIETPSRVLSLVQRRWAVQLMFVAAWADPLASGQSKPLENTHGHIFYFCLQSQEMCSAFKGLCTNSLMNHGDTGTPRGWYSWETRLGSPYLVRKR